MSDPRDAKRAEIIPDREFSFLGNARKEVERRLVCTIHKEMTGRTTADIEALIVAQTAPSEPAALIPADADGNNTTVEVTTGVQTLHFKLKKKPA